MCYSAMPGCWIRLIIECWQLQNGGKILWSPVSHTIHLMTVRDILKYK